MPQQTRRAANKRKSTVTNGVTNNGDSSNTDQSLLIDGDVNEMSIQDIANCIFTRNKDPVIEQLVQALVEKFPKQGYCNCAIEKRSRSIVLSGLPEPSEELRASEKQAELEKRVTDILDVLEVDCKPSEVFRMGRVNGGRPRLVKLILPSRSYWATALRNAHRLRTSSYSSVFVRKSMTPDERKLDYDLRQEAKDRNKSANERVWVVYKGELKRIQDLPYRQQSVNSRVVPSGQRT
ncbi:hypothetical protein Y032_0715g1768 [Ancylostoma ceylanicum]|uniref:Uncharacterized protein n=1 Tax=Ancylostoma ceylanicum TaxID=53326 RepID=A0A016WHF0_9BILA|nr:hypothetical protein Y032_0715g1768 [Ancylostoma ceylanicum]